MANQHRAVSAELADKIRTLSASGMSTRAVAKELGVHATTVLRYREANESPASAQSATAETNEIKGDSWTIALPKTRIHTLEELLEYCKVDTSIWEVERFVCNKWEMGYKDPDNEGRVVPLFQVKAWLKKNKNVAFAKDEVEKLRAEAKKFAPRFPAIKKTADRSADTVVEISISDHHFGALIWGKETGNADYDTEIAKKCWESALTSLVQRTRDFRPSKYLLILGNDQQNADNRAGTTERGTPQNMDSRYQKVFQASKDASRWAIDSLLGEAGEVDVVMVPGNHDQLATWHLGDSLISWYHQLPAVKIDNSPLFRKYYEHGVNMLMFTHGSNGKIEDYDRTMSAERPDLWGRTRWREAHTGDKHHRRMIELKGATVRILPSLRPPCSWSSENHFVGAIRAAEAYVWHKSEGLVGTAVYSLLEGAK